MSIVNITSENKNSISFDGKEFKANKDNVIEIDVEYLELALSHGFELLGTKEEENIEEKVTVKKGKK